MNDDERTANFRRNTEKLGITFGGGHRVRVESTSHPDGYENRDFIMVCGVCDVMLNLFTTPEGEIYVHGREWQRYDHEPVPKQIPKDTRREAMCDFCGVEVMLNWVYEIENRIQAVTGNTTRDYGRNWAACDACAEVIDTGDVDALIDRVMKMSPIARSPHVADKQHIRSSMYDMLGPVMATIIAKKWIGPKREPARLDPRMMPKIHAGLRRLWSNPGLYRRFASRPDIRQWVPAIFATGDETQLAHPYEVGEVIALGAFQKLSAHILSGLDVADLYWVSADFTQLALMASHDFDKLVISREELPSPFGVLVWEAPIGAIQRPDGEAAIRAVTWTLVPHGIWFNFYMQGEDADPYVDVTEMRADWGYLLTPNPGGGVRFDAEMGDPADMGEAQTAILAMLSTFFLINQPGVAEINTAPVDKKIARSWQRAGKRMPTVRLVELRRRPRRAHAESDAGGWTLQYRRFTRGHWKRQFYGPKRGLRKTIYVSPYVSGDENLPLRPDKPPVVKVLR